MKTKKKETKKPQKQIVVDEEVLYEPVQSLPVTETKSTKRFPSLVTLAIVGLVGILLGILFAYRGSPVAAIVGGQPIFKWELANVLFQRYGQQTLQGVITEKLIAAEAKKIGITISQSDIDAKAKEILSSFGSNMSVDEFLKFQGMQKQEFDNQLKLQLTVENILSKDLNITEADVKNYIASNEGVLTATDPATLQAQAKKALTDEKIGEKVQSWLEELKAKASIQSFL